MRLVKDDEVAFIFTRILCAVCIYSAALCTRNLAPVIWARIIFGSVQVS